jgi:ComF family protein
MKPVASLALETMLAVLAPPRCAACDESARRLAVFCRSCARTAAKAPGEGEPSFAALVYGGAVARAIARMKYEARPDLARPLGDLLWRALAPRMASLRGAVVVPVPLHPSRLAERGYNQSALLARRVAKHLGAPFAPRALARTRQTQQQAALDRAARVKNVAGAFEARGGLCGEHVRGRVVLLVDDVATTGATLDACERALLGAGAADVQRAVLASAPQRVEGAGGDFDDAP